MPTDNLSQTYTFTEYYPDQVLQGAGVPGTVIDGNNVVFENNGWNRAFGGWGDQHINNAPSTLAYTASTTADSPIVEFTAGALALTEWNEFQHVLLGRDLYLVETLIDDTHITVSPVPSATASGLAVKKTPNLHAVDELFASLYGGNVLKFREEPLVAVGNGPLKINGNVISASLTASKTPQLAYPISTGGYDVRNVGFTKPTSLPTLAAVAGGTKNMPQTTYSIKLTKKRLGFPGYGLAGEAVEVTLSAPNEQIQATLPAFDTSEGQSAWYVWATKSVVGQGVRGPWYLLGEYTTVTPSTVNLEWRDDELGEKLVDTNYPPPKALYVFTLDDLLCFASAFGAPDSSGDPTAPGPGVAVGKPFNPEGFATSASAFVAPAEDIRAVYVGNSRAYFITKNRQHIGTLTGSQTTPLVIRPYWHAGGSHQNSGVMCGEVLFVLVGDAIVRTVTGEDADTSFSARVKSALAPFVQARVFLGYDARNQWLVVFHSQDNLGGGGKYITKALSYNLKTDKWNTPCLLGDGTTADFIVTGVATINQRLFFTTSDGSTYEWDNGAQTITGAMAPQFNDFGGAHFTKVARRVEITGHLDGNISLARNYSLTESPVPVRQLVNAAHDPTHFPVWRPNWHGKSLSMIITFAVPARTRLVDSVVIEVERRTGAVY